MSEWQPIETVGRLDLAVDLFAHGKRYINCWWCEYERRWYSGSTTLVAIGDRGVTHWMSIPKNPK